MVASLYTDALAETILNRLSTGETLVDICKTAGMPALRTVADWRRSHPDFDKAYQDAMLVGCHALIDGTLAIADNTEEDPASRKVRIWARHELAKRKRPDVLGDKMTLAGDPERPLSGLSDAEVDARLKALMAKQGVSEAE